MGQIGSLFSGGVGSAIGGVGNALGGLFGGGGSSGSSSGGGGSSSTPSNASIDTPGPYQNPTPGALDPTVEEQIGMAEAAPGQSTADAIGGSQSGDTQDPEITARQKQKQQQNLPPAPPQTPGLTALQQPDQLAKLAASVLGGQQRNPWQLGGGPQGMNPLTQNLTNLAGQIPVQPGAVATAPTATRRIAVSPLPPPAETSAASRPQVADQLRSLLLPQGRQDPTIAAGGPGSSPVPSDPSILAGGPSVGAQQPQPQAPAALTPEGISSAIRAHGQRMASQASNFGGQEHDPTVPRSGNAGLDQVKSKLASLESANGPNNGYGSVGPQLINRQGMRGYGVGKYQVMSYNVGPWTERFLGRRMTPEQFLRDPHAQDRLANAVMNHLHRQYGNWQDVASVWRTGHPVYHHFPARRPTVPVSRPQPAYQVHHGRS